MNVTRRGWVVICSGVLAMVAGGMHGARTLDAIAVPALVLVVLAFGWVLSLDKPTVERVVPDPAPVGTTHEMKLRVTSGGLVSIHEELSGTEPTSVDQPIDTETWVSYPITYVRRGRHTVGPLHVTVSDPLELFTRTFRYTIADPILVYPQLSPVSPPPSLSALASTSGVIERQEFERLREHVPGESLSSVDWKTSAKHDDLFVVEYSHSESGGVTLVAEGVGNRQNVDAMARAVASLVAYLRTQGVSVTVVLPNGTVSTDQTAFFQRLLFVLATTSPGRVSTAALESADLSVVGRRGTAMVTVDGKEFPFTACLEPDRGNAHEQIAPEVGLS
ncbi:DUF58 domain-containing protein [Halocatena halophila]|uniref:DUF58 domain-containing protein n=1 Tax=Halocatena halophila TaxID=2814576 RepID=UPI002ED2FDC2